MSEQNAIELADWLKNSDRDDIDYGRSKEIDAIEATLRRLSTINQAAKVLAKSFDYPWEHMPEQGRDNMRKIASDVLALAAAKDAKA